jgi:hypothetical protein
MRGHPAGGVDAADSGPDLAAVGAMSAVADAGHPVPSDVAVRGTTTSSSLRSARYH